MWPFLLDLIHLLHQNKTQLAPETSLTTNSALLNIAKILHRDTTPPIKPNLVPPLSTSSLASSEGLKRKEPNQPSIGVSSEVGDKINSNVPIEDVFKTTIIPMDASKITPYPTLYETRNVDSTTQQYTKKTLKQNKYIGTPYSKEQSNKLLKDYQSIPKESHTYKEPVHKHHQLPLPRIPRPYITIPKHYKPTRTFSRASPTIFTQQIQ